MFISCEVCGKKLIERKPNGIFHFMFGRSKVGSIVDIEIYGSVKMVCSRRSCRHVNIFNYFPKTGESVSNESK